MKKKNLKMLKKNSKMIIGIGIVAVLILSVFFLYGNFRSNGNTEGNVVNGIYNSANGECEPDPNNVVGMGTCCFNEIGKQVDCNNPSEIIGEGNGQILAIYQGQTGIMSIQHVFTITNTGNVDIINAWIGSATWSPIHTTLTSAYASIIGINNGKAISSTDPDSYVSWSTGNIDLQSIGGTPGSPKNYILTLIASADAEGLPTSSSTKTASMTVEKEAIGFYVDINFGM